MAGPTQIRTSPFSRVYRSTVVSRSHHFLLSRSLLCVFLLFTSSLLPHSTPASASPVINPAKVKQISWKPRAFVYEGLLTDLECDHLISIFLRGFIHRKHNRCRKQAWKAQLAFLQVFGGIVCLEERQLTLLKFPAKKRISERKRLRFSSSGSKARVKRRLKNGGCVNAETVGSVHKLLFFEGFLDAQFVQLQQLQDESNPDFVVEVVSLFFQDSEKLLNDLAGVLDQTTVDFKKIDAHVHQLKGSSSSIGALRVKDSSITFRNACDQQNIIACHGCLQELKQEYHIVKSKLENLFTLEQQIIGAGGLIPKTEMNF